MLKTHIFVLDNKDSFIFTLVDFFHTFTDTISIYRNTVEPHSIVEKMQEAKAQNFKPILVLSPGPKSPSDIPMMDTLIHLVKGHFPILGICLGHQAIVENYGGEIGLCSTPIHGQKTPLHFVKHPIFEGISPLTEVGRYHSLEVIKMPEEDLDVIATAGNSIMAVIDGKNCIIGFQFHPESILTSVGEKVLGNTVNYMKNIYILEQKS